MACIAYGQCRIQFRMMVSEHAQTSNSTDSRTRTYITDLFDLGPAGKLLQLLDRHPYRPAHIHIIVRSLIRPNYFFEKIAG